MARFRFNDLRTDLEKAQLDFRRETLGLPSKLFFETFNQQSREWVEIGRISDGWCADEVLAEGSGGFNEYAVTATWRENLEQLFKTCTAVRFGSTRLEKRATDPANTAPYVLRMRAQIISGMHSEAHR